jgi:hypothetical protein
MADQAYGVGEITVDLNVAYSFGYMSCFVLIMDQCPFIGSQHSIFRIPNDIVQQILTYLSAQSGIPCQGLAGL